MDTTDPNTRINHIPKRAVSEMKYAGKQAMNDALIQERWSKS